MLLVKDDLVIRLGAYPAKYALCGTDVHQQNGLQKSSHAETRQYQVQQEEITMSAECAVGLILEYFHATEVDRGRRNGKDLDMGDICLGSIAIRHFWKIEIKQMTKLWTIWHSILRFI